MNEVMEKIKARDPGEKEFQQAVTEVMESVARPGPKSDLPSGQDTGKAC